MIKGRKKLISNWHAFNPLPSVIFKSKYGLSNTTLLMVHVQYMINGLSCHDYTSQALFRVPMGNIERQHLLGPNWATFGLLSSTICALQQFALNVHVKHSDLTWPDLIKQDETDTLRTRAGRSSEVERSLIMRWVVGSILHGVDPLSYFSFQPVLHDWCNKGRGMWYPVCGMVHIKEPLLLIDKSSLCGGSGFPFSLSEWSLTICLTPYNRR